jgi:hypothetical protein
LPGTTPALQLYVTPPVEEEPLTVAVVVAQVILCPLPMLMFGILRLLITDTVAVFTQPLAGFVTVTVYTPAVEVVPVEVFPGAMPELQEKVAPGVEEEEVTVAVATAQVIN